MVNFEIVLIWHIEDTNISVDLCKDRIQNFEILFDLLNIVLVSILKSLVRKRDDGYQLNVVSSLVSVSCTLETDFI